MHDHVTIVSQNTPDLFVCEVENSFLRLIHFVVFEFIFLLIVVFFVNHPFLTSFRVSTHVIGTITTPPSALITIVSLAMTCDARLMYFPLAESFADPPELKTDLLVSPV
jgi:hypothetical protein